MPKAYVIATELVKDPEGMNAYVEQAVATIVEAGGKPLAFQPDTEVLEGEWDRPQTVLIEFESVEAARAWYESESYQPLIPQRQAASESSLILLSGIE